MNFSNLTLSVKQITVWDVIIFVLMVFFLIFNETLQVVIEYGNTVVGWFIMLIILILLFMYRNPILGILFIFVIYIVITTPLLNRGIGNHVLEIPKSAPSSANIRESQTNLNNMRNTVSLEEEIIAQKVPMGRSDSILNILPTTFKPVSQPIYGGGSLV